MQEPQGPIARASIFEGWRLILLASAVIVITACVAYGHDEGHGPREVSSSEIYKPTPLPDRIVLTWSSDPATSQAVTWRTDDSVLRAYAEIAEAEDGPGFVNHSERLQAVTQPLADSAVTANYHTVNFVDLQPSTKYAYRVGDGVNWSEWNQFTTASDQAEPFTFVYFGDAQEEVHSHWSRVVREAYKDAPRAAFLLHAGDLINRANADGEWGEWFAASGHIHRMIPCIATPGNHEYSGASISARLLRRRNAPAKESLSEQWRPTFAFPEHGPPGLEETVYWIDYQGARIISLNSNERIDEQTDWLRRVLEENPMEWTIVTFHHPVYSSKASRDNVELRDAWQPLFDEFRVDLVLQGHDHTYSRSGLMAHENVATGVTARNPAAGTVYVVSVSGPKMYPLDQRPIMRREAEDTQLYQIIHVEPDRLRYEARTATGRLYDSFSLVKRGRLANALVDHIPDTPERIRDASLAGK
jgi:3',5'-cyclic AMP phosphodiesterase CpdA